MEDIRYIRQTSVPHSTLAPHDCVTSDNKTLFLLGESQIEVYALSFQGALKVTSFPYDVTSFSEKVDSCSNEDGSILCIGDPYYPPVSTPIFLKQAMEAFLIT